MPQDMQTDVMSILREAKHLAQQYRSLTGMPLGITGEVAEYEAARILGLDLTVARQAGYDAIEKRDGREHRLQIKGRYQLPGCKPGQRMGAIDVTKDFDGVLLVLLGERFEATAIYEADPDAVLQPLAEPGSKARNERGARMFSQFAIKSSLQCHLPSYDCTGCYAVQSAITEAADRRLQPRHHYGAVRTCESSRWPLGRAATSRLPLSAAAL